MRSEISKGSWSQLPDSCDQTVEPPTIKIRELQFKTTENLKNLIIPAKINNKRVDAEVFDINIVNTTDKEENEDEETDLPSLQNSDDEGERSDDAESSAEEDGSLDFSNEPQDLREESDEDSDTEFIDVAKTSSKIRQMKVEEDNRQKLIGELTEQLPPHLHDLFKRSCNNEEIGNSEIQAVFQLLNEFSDVFAKDDFDLGCFTEVKNSIDTGDANPINQRMRRKPWSFENEEQQHLKKMLKGGSGVYIHSLPRSV